MSLRDVTATGSPRGERGVQVRRSRGRPRGKKRAKRALSWSIEKVPTYTGGHSKVNTSYLNRAPGVRQLLRLSSLIGGRIKSTLPRSNKKYKRYRQADCLLWKTIFLRRSLGKSVEVRSVEGFFTLPNNKDDKRLFIKPSSSGGLAGVSAGPMASGPP